MRSFQLAVLLFQFLASTFAQQPKEATLGDAQKLVKLRRIVVEGTRLPALSVIRLAQIKAGDEVNFMKLQAALQKVTLTGLIRNIDFEYESLPDTTAPASENDVILHMACTDEAPVATASISIAKIDEADIWKWLAEVDPLFTRQLPPNERAIRFYANLIGKYMETHGDPKFQENFAITADTSSSTGSAIPDKVSFKSVKRRGAK